MPELNDSASNAPNTPDPLQWYRDQLGFPATPEQVSETALVFHRLRMEELRAALRENRQVDMSPVYQKMDEYHRKRRKEHVGKLAAGGAQCPE